MVPVHVMKVYGEVDAEIHKQSSNIINIRVSQKQWSLNCYQITTTPTSNLSSSIFLKSCQKSYFSPNKVDACGINARFFGNVFLV
jgi:hypothetical protein